MLEGLDEGGKGRVVSSGMAVKMVGGIGRSRMKRLGEPGGPVVDPGARRVWGRQKKGRWSRRSGGRRTERNGKGGVEAASEKAAVTAINEAVDGGAKGPAKDGVNGNAVA